MGVPERAQDERGEEGDDEGGRDAGDDDEEPDGDALRGRKGVLDRRVVDVKLRSRVSPTRWRLRTADLASEAVDMVDEREEDP